MRNYIIFDHYKKYLRDKCPSLSVIDVGVSGGFSDYWQPFGYNFTGLGIDTLIHTISSLDEGNNNPRIKYLAACVEWKEWKEQNPLSERHLKSTDSFSRTSAMRSAKKNLDAFHIEENNMGQPLEYSHIKIELDDILYDLPEKRVDFIKTDTDGHDLSALKSADKMLSSDMVLGVKTECNLHSAPHDMANNFANIDIYMRSKGFTLLSLDLCRYAKGDFPWPFIANHPSETIRGGHQWGDALYFRDFCNPQFKEIAGWEPSSEQLIRMAFILEAHRAIDTLVELMNKFADKMGIHEHLKHLQDELVRKYMDPKYGETYQELINNFDEDYKLFYPIPR